MDCVRLFTKEDILDGDEKPVRCAAVNSSRLFPCGVAVVTAVTLLVFPQTCYRCKARRRCTKKFTIQKFPKILVLRILYCRHLQITGKHHRHGNGSWSLTLRPGQT